MGMLKGKQGGASSWKNVYSLGAADHRVGGAQIHLGMVGSPGRASSREEEL